MLSQIKPKAEPLIDILARPFLKFNPNLLTIVGIIPPLLFFVLIINRQYIPGFVAMFGSAFDFLDGAVARRTGKVTKFGGLLDSTLDRLSDLLFLSAFGFAGIVRWELVISA